MAGATDDGDPSLAAVVHTARKYGIAWDLFDDFLGSMRMDLTTTDYPDRAALDRYMYGSAEVIGLQMLPVLGTVSAREEAAPYAAALGKAFQLTNFLRDIDEDLQRGRIYLPADELAAHRSGPRRADVVPHASAHRSRGCGGRWSTSTPRPGASTTSPDAASRCCIRGRRPCIAAALTLYSEILDRIEEIDFAVFSQRATVGTARRLQVAGGGLVEAWARTGREVSGPDDGPLAVPVRPRRVPGDHRATGVARVAACTGRPGAPQAAVLPVAAVFVVWDAIAIAAHVWTYNPQYVTGIRAARRRCRSRNCCSSW